MYDIIGVNDNEFIYNDEAYPIACLNVYSNSSYNKLDSLPQYKQNYILLQVNDNKYVNYYMNGIGHLHLLNDRI